MVFDEEVSDLYRLRELTGLLVKYGLAPWADADAEKNSPIAVLARLTPWYKKSEAIAMPFPERLRKALEEMGPIFVKFGQMMSTRADLLPKEYIVELSKLQNKAPPFSWDEAKPILMHELGDDPDKAFKSFVREPIASASLGQAYEATLLSGERVAIKVQRPDMKPKIEQDLRIMRQLADFVINTDKKKFEPYNVPKILDEFEDAIMREVNYKIEARSTDIFSENFAKDLYIRAPKVYWDYTTEKVLTLEYVDGENLKELIHNGDLKRNKIIADRMMGSYLKQLFEDQFFHADPHPSNLIVTQSNILYFIDFGMVKRLSKEFSKNLGNILMSLITGDVEKLVDNLQEGGIAPKDINRERIITDMEIIYTSYFKPRAGTNVNVGGGLEKVLELFQKYHMNLPSDFALLIKSFIEIEGTATELYPKFDLVEYIKKYFTNPTHVETMGMAKAEELKTTVFDIINSVQKIPSALDKFTRTLSEGSVKIDFNHQHLEDLTKQIDKVSNRISAALLLAALIIGSSLIMSSGIGIEGQAIMGFPMVGIVVFMLSVVIGIWMILRIVQKSGI